MKWIQDRTTRQPSWDSSDGRWRITFSDHNGNELYHLSDQIANLSKGCFPDFAWANDVAEAIS